MCTRRSRKVIWDMINTLFQTLQLSKFLFLLPLACANIRPWPLAGPLVPFFQISLKNSKLKTTHNTFRDCRMHFFRQPFSKQLYTCISNGVRHDVIQQFDVTAYFMFLGNIRLKAIPHHINDQSAWFFLAVLGVGKCFLQLKFECKSTFKSKWKRF